VLATAAVMAHEIPHEVGDFMILLNAGFTKRRAFVFNLLSGSSRWPAARSATSSSTR